MRRVWHPYWTWEDWKAGMWRGASASEGKVFLQKAIAFTGDHELYGSYMLRAVVEFPFAAEHNLTDASKNRLAWIGHAAAVIAINCPEKITRQAWGLLSKEQQDKANAQAEIALQRWTESHEEKDSQLCLDLEKARI